MKTRVPAMALSSFASGSNPVEAARTSGIHLVTSCRKVTTSQVVASKIDMPRATFSRSQYIRESEKMNTLALAGAALIAPAVWVGHALLVWLETL